MQSKTVKGAANIGHDVAPARAEWAKADFDQWDMRRNLGVTSDELAHAFGAVGHNAEKVRYFLCDRLDAV